MFHTVADFLLLWQDEANHSEQFLLALSDKSLDELLIPGQATLKQLAWHFIETPKEMLEHTGLNIKNDTHRESTNTIKTLVEAHRQIVHSVAHQIQTHWHNKDLHHIDNIDGKEWSRSKTLATLIFRLIHYRGQMTVLMQIAKLKVPQIYGLVKEE